MDSDMLQDFTAAPVLNYALKRQRPGDLIWDSDGTAWQQNAPGYLYGPYNCVIVFDKALDVALDGSGELTSYDVIVGWLNLIEEVA